MPDTKLTVRVPRALLENAKQYAASHHTTLTNLIETYLRHIPAQKGLKDAPLVRCLSGLLSEEVSPDSYSQYRDKKYGR